jgi:hypothetical protein
VTRSAHPSTGLTTESAGHSSQSLLMSHRFTGKRRFNRSTIEQERSPSTPHRNCPPCGPTAEIVIRVVGRVETAVTRSFPDSDVWTVRNAEALRSAVYDVRVALRLLRIRRRRLEALRAHGLTLNSSIDYGSTPSTRQIRITLA